MYTTLKSTYLYLACSCRSMRSLPDSQTASFPDLRNSRNLFLGWKRRLLKLGNPIPVRRASESRSSRPSFFVKTTSAWFHGNGPSSNHHKPIPASLIWGAWPISRQLMRSWRSSTRRVRWWSWTPLPWRMTRPSLTWPSKSPVCCKVHNPSHLKTIRNPK